MSKKNGSDRKAAHNQWKSNYQPPKERLEPHERRQVVKARDLARASARAKKHQD